MTIAISLKVNDGLVLAADSASTLMIQTPQGSAVAQVFNNANKVFNLRKGLPIGFISWGAGSIGQAAISTLVKDLRALFTSDDTAHMDWHIDPKSYTIEQVAQLSKKFIFDENYAPAFTEWKGDKPLLGFLIGGYSSQSNLAEEFVVEINKEGQCSDARAIRPKESNGVNWSGEPEAISRLILGYSPALATVLEQKLGVKPDQISKAMEIISQSLKAQVVWDAMPIQDAIDLAEFLVHVTERYSRYTPGAATVGGPIEIAAITKHEGFKWVKRKFYYSEEYNPAVNFSMEK